MQIVVLLVIQQEDPIHREVLLGTLPVEVLGLIHRTPDLLAAVVTQEAEVREVEAREVAGVLVLEEEDVVKILKIKFHLYEKVLFTIHRCSIYVFS